MKFENPSDKGLFNIPHMDKIVHFFLYSFLCFLLLLESSYMVLKRKHYLLFISICLIYGSIIELLQLTLTQRNGDVFDIVANLTGSVFAIPVYNIYRKIK